MTFELIAGGVILVLTAAVGWLSYKYGQAKEKQKTDEGKTDDMAKDAETASKPYVPNPISDVRRMCDKD